MQTRRSAARAVLLVMILVASVVAVAPGSASATGSTPDRPTSEDLAQELDWRPCYPERTAETGVIFECADLVAPLDYDWIRRGDSRWRERSHRTITVALIRIPAGDQANRQGSIMFNPGGPGGSGINFILGFGPAAPFFLGADVPARFDLVGFDPRGIGQSTPVRCFDTEEEAASVFPPVAFPLNRIEERLFRRADTALALACRRYDGARRIGRHVSTANVARDMDLIRASMGDESTNFLGLSYGTFVAATYANLFPDRVRAVVADGVLDPVAWVNVEADVPFSTRLRSDEGAAETLEEFFVQCEAAAPGNCAFAPDSANRYAALADKLLNDGPIQLPNPVSGGTDPFTYQDLIGFSLGNLYNPFGYADMAGGLAFFESIAFGASAQPAPSPAVLARLQQEPYDNFVEGFPAVGCVDTSNPRSYRAWREAGEAADAEFGYFGRLWTWASSPCARWPFRDRDRYQGPFTATTASPVLVIGNFYDPATRYEGAQALRSLLPNSSLLSVDVPGHTSLGLSLCAGAITGQYFLDPTIAVQVDGFTCPSEFNAFDFVAAPPAAMSAAEAGAALAEAPDVQASVADMMALREMLMEEAGMLPPGVGG